VRGRRVGDRRAFLTAVADVAALTLELDDLLAQLRDLVVPTLADLFGIHLPTEQGLVRYLPADLAVEAPNPHLSGIARRLVLDEVMPFTARLPATVAFASGRTVRVDELSGLPQVPDVRTVIDRGGTSGASTPLIVGGEVLGTMSLARTGSRPPLTAEDIELVELVAARAAVAVAHARRLDREREHAATLQRALLPRLPPQLPGLDLAARYLPSMRDTAVGGDWYDVIPHDGLVTLVVGDVMGRGVAAAAIMGQMRTAARAAALLGRSPAQMLGLLDQLLVELAPDSLVTATAVRVDPVSGRAWAARAGHPLPLIAAPDSRARPLIELHPGERPLGTAGAFDDHLVTLPPGARLALFTDGLVESRHEDDEETTERLGAALATGPHDLDDLADHALRAVGRAHGHHDDIALLLVRRPTRT
jgi:serine phosphatase RsbU (regulator of sigma subunit)